MHIEQFLIVLLCTLVQNVFGVGILVFGTPILLSMGYGYLEVLGILCPSSLGVSLVQIFMIRSTKFPKPSEVFQSISGVVIGTILLSMFAVPIFIYVITAIMMFFAGILRLSGDFQRAVVKALEFKAPYFYFLNAVFHGFSNLGGVLLVFKNSISTINKNQKLTTTAFIYALYVIFQIIVLSFSGNAELFLAGALIFPFSILLSIFLSGRPLALLSPKKMDAALGVFFISVGGVLIYKILSFAEI
ncbi:hypothetical protein N9I90_03795 [Alphaproteobacteria bacterium]|nr:hypothetical protein [Alphaproteobacteria bacterium]